MDCVNLRGHLFVTNEQCAQQVETIEAAGLVGRFRIEGRGQSGAYLGYGSIQD